jgi:hypothetical protein
MKDLLSAAQSSLAEKIPKAFAQVMAAMAAQSEPGGDKHLCALCVVRAGWCHRDDGLQDWGYQGEHLHRRPCSGRIPKHTCVSFLLIDAVCCNTMACLAERLTTLGQSNQGPRVN